MAKIRHPELNVEAEVHDEAVPGWLEVGWEVGDDSSNEAPAPDQVEGAEAAEDAESTDSANEEE